MEYKESFLELVKSSIPNKQYVGLGNPNAKILIIGKEAGIDSDDKKNISDYEKNAEFWEKGDVDFSKPYPAKNKLKNKNHTWQKYQKLHNLIFKSNPLESAKITFVEKIFTTELSNLPSHNTKDAKAYKHFKAELKKRKVEFLESAFIKQFPIIIIAAMDSNYISNHGIGEIREIDNIFGVKYTEPRTCSTNNRYYIHHSIDKNYPKLLIHTRQFSNGISNLLITSIADEIKSFSKNNAVNLHPEY